MSIAMFHDLKVNHEISWVPGFPVVFPVVVPFHFEDLGQAHALLQKSIASLAPERRSASAKPWISVKWYPLVN